MSLTRSNSKNLKQQSPVKSPRNQYGLAYELTQDPLHNKLVQKNRKLKQAIHQLEKHNAQLHGRVKHYRNAGREAKQSQQREGKQLRARIGELEVELARAHDKRAKKGHLQMRLHQLEQQLQSKEAKNSLLQKKNEEVKSNLEAKNLLIKELQASIKIKSQIQGQQSKRAAKLGNIVQQMGRELTKLKESLKDAQNKLDKAHLQVYEHLEKHKRLSEELRQSRNKNSALEKELSKLKQQAKQANPDLVQKIQHISRLQRSLLQQKHSLQKQAEKTQSLSQKYAKLEKQHDTLLNEFHSLTASHQQLVTTQYETQRDFERQLHTIVKELTRRHLVSKSVGVSHGSSTGTGCSRYSIKDAQNPMQLP